MATSLSGKKLFIRLVILGVVIWLIWAMVGFHVTESHGPITAAEAESMLDLKLPPSAKHIRAARYSQWVEFAEFARFEAPVADCLQFAATVTHNATTQPARDFDLPSAARPLRANAFKDFSWYDLDKAQDVVTAGGGPSTPQVWIDQQRGVCYYRKMD